MAYENTLQVETDPADEGRILEPLFRKYHRKLTFICYRYVQNWEDSRELAQEAFFKAFRHMGGFENRSQPFTWLTRIAINECLSYLAKRGRRRLQVLHYQHDLDSETEQPDFGQANDDKRVVHRLLHIADPATRKVLMLILNQGLNHTQIAAILGVSRVAITRRLTRFRGKAVGHGLRE
ncbi:MAG: RNA polymerase sigma factor [Fibrobacteres bacterium]|nr:RNA polymerase sigma factor [Fibrobacterota bacterium]